MLNLKRIPVREQPADVRRGNNEEVCLGYNQDEATQEAVRCLGCKKPRCVEGCPVGIDIPGFIAKVKQGDVAGAAAVIGKSVWRRGRGGGEEERKATGSGRSPALVEEEAGAASPREPGCAAATTDASGRPAEKTRPSGEARNYLLTD